jgi:hypothetical protein
MRNQYEDPRKSEMRERCWVALDEAGYDVEPEPEPIEIPPESGLRGRIVADLVTVNGAGDRSAYCLRTSSVKPLPQWLANWSRATKQMDRLDLYIVIEEAPSPELRRSCEAAGAGILLLRLEGLEVVLGAGAIPEDVAKEECRQRMVVLRRRLENKLHLQLEAIDANYNEARVITARFPDELEDDYINRIETSGVEWRQWAEELSERLDAMSADCDDGELDLIEQALERGA